MAHSSENFLVDTGATYSVLSFYSGVFSFKTCAILGATGKAITKRLTQELLFCWDEQILSHQFLVVPECPPPLLGKDLSLLLKSCSYCSPGRRCFETLSCGQTYFLPAPKMTRKVLQRNRPPNDYKASGLLLSTCQLNNSQGAQTPAGPAHPMESRV